MIIFSQSFFAIILPYFCLFLDIIEKNKKNSQPSQIKTCGSTFKNPKKVKAWKLIKDSGCTKISVGKASISEKHCNFFVNEGGATSKDIENLIQIVKKKVSDKYKIKLDLEIELIGDVLLLIESID